MTVNAVLRAFSGYILFLLAFLLRSVNLGTIFHHAVSHNFALGALALGLSVGSLASMVRRLLLPRPGAAADHVLRAVRGAGGHRAVRLGIRPVRGRPREATAIFCASLAKLGAGLDRRPRDRRRDPVLDVRGLRDAEPGGERGRRPGRRARVHARQRAGGPRHRRGRPRRRAGPARRARRRQRVRAAAPRSACPAASAQVADALLPAGYPPAPRSSGARSSATARSSSAIGLASFGSGCLPRR